MGNSVPCRRPKERSDQGVEFLLIERTMRKGSVRIDLPKLAEEARKQVASMRSELEGHAKAQSAAAGWPTRFIAAGLKKRAASRR